ncbi:MAG: hypothetical protein AAF430_19900 [Myxococcota bacterium]
MNTSRAAALALAIALVGTASASPAGPRDPVYQWSDEDGNVRYTTDRDRIPDAYQERVREIEPGHDAFHNAALARGARPLGRNVVTDEDAKYSDALPAVEAAAPVDAPAPDPALEERILALETAIAADERWLEEAISDPERAKELRSTDEFRAVAERLPRRQAELQDLLQQRGASDAPTP